jgi:hypothetical protein
MATGNEIQITFDGKTHSFELTLGEIEKLEDTRRGEFAPANL